MIASVDLDKNGAMSIDEFLELIYEDNPILDRVSAGIPLEVDEGDVTIETMRDAAFMSQNEKIKS